MTMGEIKFYNPDSYENIPYDKDGPHSPECIQEHLNHLFLKSLFDKIRVPKSWQNKGLGFSRIRT